ncbi:MAG TPA: YoaK family protein [Ramlibacter sp.]
MPIKFLGRLTDRERTRTTNRQLGGVLAFVAGAVNAGGFLAVGRYTSHMTGAISSLADELVLGDLLLASGALAMLVAFVAGAMSTALMVNWGRRRQLHGQYALPLLAEAALLLAFGVLGTRLRTGYELVAPATVLLLCFVMGLQNAIITKASQAEIRTTHMTGIVTDIGIELGRLVYRNHAPELDRVHFVKADRDRLSIHLTILSLFIVGGVCGALAFKAFGFLASVPLAVLLALIAAPALLRDIAARARRPDSGT